MKTITRTYLTEPVESPIRYDHILPSDNNPKLTGLWPTGTRKTQQLITEYSDGTRVESERFFSEAKGLSDWEKSNLSPDQQQQRLQAMGDAEFAYWKETDPKGYDRYFREAKEQAERHAEVMEIRRLTALGPAEFYQWRVANPEDFKRYFVVTMRPIPSSPPSLSFIDRY